MTLGTPTGGAALGKSPINTLTITEPTPTATPTPTPSPTSTAPPVIIGERPLFERKTNKKGKPAGKPVLQGFTLEFSRPMGTSAGDSLDFSLEKIVAKATKKKPAKLRNVGFTVAYSPFDNTVTVNVAGKQTFPTGGLLERQRRRLERRRGDARWQSRICHRQASKVDRRPSEAIDM